MRIAIITLIIISAVAIGFFGERFYRTKITNDFVQEANNKKELLKTAENIWELWRKGLSSRIYEKYKDHCPAKLYSDDKCNKDLISCYLNKNQESSFEIDEINRSLYGGLSPREGLRVLLSRGSSSLSLILDKSCSKIYLPQRIYGFGEKLNPDWNERFDNFKRHIFIDKNLIPAKGMKYTQMKKFCENRGMQLLESHILDAAVFHPVDMRNTRPLNFLNPKLPWTRKFKSTFIDKAQKIKISNLMKSIVTTSIQKSAEV